MEAVTVHKINPDLLVSLMKLPGFKKLGSCVIRDTNGEKSGLVEVFYAGDFFKKDKSEEFDKVKSSVLKLARNYAIKNNLGVASTRLNLSLALRSAQSDNKRNDTCGTGTRN